MKGPHGGAEVSTVASQQKGRGTIFGPGVCMFTLPEWVHRRGTCNPPLFLLVINLSDYLQLFMIVFIFTTYFGHLLNITCLDLHTLSCSTLTCF